jgi:transposase
MLTELSVVEQRYLAVREVLDGVKVTDVATRYGVDRRTLHRWLVRYASEGLGALTDRTSRPDRCPHQTPPHIEARIVALRRAHPSWGPRTILSKLRRELAQPSSRSSIYRCLLRHRLIDHKPRRRRPQRPTGPATTRSRSSERCPTLAADQGESMTMSHSYRSQTETRVLRLHTTAKPHPRNREALRAPLGHDLQRGFRTGTPVRPRRSGSFGRRRRRTNRPPLRRTRR